MALLRSNERFRWLLAAVALVNLGVQVAFVTINLHAFVLTGSTGVVGTLALVTLVPMLGLGMFGGYLADHSRRSHVVIGAQIAALLASLLLLSATVLGRPPIALLYAVGATWAAATALASPARMSSVPLVVARGSLAAANSLVVVVVTASLLVAPLVAGAVVGMGSYAAAYGLEVVLAAGATVCIARSRLPGMGGGRRVPLRSVADGLRHVWRTPAVVVVLLADLVAMVAASPRVLFPAAGTDRFFGGGPATSGALFAAIAAGGVLGTVGVPDTGSGATRRVTVLTLGWGACCGVFGLSLLRAGGTWSPWLVVALISLLAAGAMDAAAGVMRQTTVQEMTRPEHLGQVQGLIFTIGVAGPRLGDALGGWAADALGEGRAGVLQGLACVLGGGVLLRLLGGRRR